MTALGANQRGVLRAVVEYGTWPGAWVWKNPSTTVSILNSLVRRDLVEHKPSESPHHPGTYRATDAGRELVAKETTR
jgi:DNA-binding PadR family transcriptional regulator